MPANRCHACGAAIPAFDFFVSLPQGPVCSSCLVNRVCGPLDFKVLAREPEKPFTVDGLEELYPWLRPLPEAPGIRPPARESRPVGPAPVAPRAPRSPQAGAIPRPASKTPDDPFACLWPGPGVKARA